MSKITHYLPNIYKFFGDSEKQLLTRIKNQTCLTSKSRNN